MKYVREFEKIRINGVANRTKDKVIYDTRSIAKPMYLLNDKLEDMVLNPCSNLIDQK